MTFTCDVVGAEFNTCATWTRWKREYLPTLQERPKWHQERRNLQVNDIVLIKDESTPRNEWPMGVVTDVEPDTKGLV